MIHRHCEKYLLAGTVVKLFDYNLILLTLLFEVTWKSLLHKVESRYHEHELSRISRYLKCHTVSNYYLGSFSIYGLSWLYEISCYHEPCYIELLAMFNHIFCPQKGFQSLFWTFQKIQFIENRFSVDLWIFVVLFWMAY